MNCRWVIAWVGDCNKESGEHAFCEEHRNLPCSGGCGKPATHECSMTVGPLVCGFPLCEDCHHDDNAALTHGGALRNFE